MQTEIQIDTTTHLKATLIRSLVAKVTQTPANLTITIQISVVTNTINLAKLHIEISMNLGIKGAREKRR